MENITREEAIKEVEEIMRKGEVPIVSLSLFDSLKNIQISEKVENQLLYTLELCSDFASDLKRYSKDFQEKYLSALRKSDIIDNQAIEKEDSFLISLYYSMNSDFAIDKLMQNVGSPLDKEKFISFHDLLITGSSSQNKKGLREDNLKFVGEYVTNPETLKTERKICYFPIDYRNIDSAINLFLDFYNKDLPENAEHMNIIKPIVVHGLVATLQLFKDGNTRYGRLLQTVGLWKALNKELNIDFDLPFVYGTRQYASVRGEYRALVNNLACNADAKAWEDWILFNFRKLQDCIFYNEYNMQKLTSLLHAEKTDEPKL